MYCSDKGLEKVPYGIPYNSRYVLLMNNRIDSIQLDLLNEYLSMEFLVLSNNRLTDGSIEGAFEGIPALRRLYLDRNLLESVPTDLPASLEELRLDNNHLNGNLISSVGKASFLHLPHLEHLGLASNKIARVASGAFRALPVLHQLDLCHNALSQVPRQLPWGLHSVALTHNKIHSVPRDAFCWGGSDLGLSSLVLVQLEDGVLRLASLPFSSKHNDGHCGQTVLFLFHQTRGHFSKKYDLCPHVQ
uniref:Uncharacterized protein n=1 Tax=Oncorhynchus tshawytscha TaxID=74940 RepID=A0AAZ3S903_ONCTS